jgi:hypothetical protein
MLTLLALGQVAHEANELPHDGARVIHFMNKFRKLGYIDYNGYLKVHNSLLNVVLYEKPEINADNSPRCRAAARPAPRGLSK